MSRWIGYIIVPLLAIATFGVSLKHGFAPIDDQFLIVDNEAAHGLSFDHLKTAFTTFDPELYIPLTLVSYQLNYSLLGADAFGFHLVNLLLHALNASLLLLLLRRLTGDHVASVIAAAIFAVHPMGAEAVVWISARKDLLMTTFTLGALLLYLSKREWPGVLAYLCALLSKVTAMFLPAVLVVLAKTRGQPVRWRSIIPPTVLSVIFIAIALFGKERVLGEGSFNGILLAGKSTLFILAQFFFPINVGPFHVHHGPLISISVLLPWLSLILICALLWRYRHRFPLVSLGFTMFFLFLAPTFLQASAPVEQVFTADRYAYLPMIGLCLMVAACIRSLPRSFLPGFVVVIALFMFGSYRYASQWSSAEALYTHALDKDPASVIARTSLARMHRDKKEYEEAFGVLKGGLIHGDHPALHIGAGMIYARTGQVGEARAQFEQARQMDPGNPEALFALGSLLEQTDKKDEALPLFQKAVELDPSYIAARLGYARMLIHIEDLETAKEQLREVLEWDPDSEEALELCEILKC